MSTGRIGRALLWLGPLAALMIAACGGDADDAPQPADPTATALSSGTRIATPTPTLAVATTPSRTTTPNSAAPRTGRAELDRIVDLTVRGDITALVALIKYTELACANAQGSGGAPDCLAGETPGTVVKVMPFAGCEGEHVRPNLVEALITSQLAGRQPKLHAAYRLKDSGTQLFPRGAFGVLFETAGAGGSGPLGMEWGVDEQGQIVSLWRGCGATAADIFARNAGADVFLRPR
jgi:hypothetical protein